MSTIHDENLTKCEFGCALATINITPFATFESRKALIAHLLTTGIDEVYALYCKRGDAIPLKYEEFVGKYITRLTANTYTSMINSGDFNVR